MSGDGRKDQNIAGGKDLQVKSHLKELRMARGWNQMQLAAFSGMNLGVVRRAERGQLLRIRTTTIFRIANVLEVGPADIWPVLGKLPGKIKKVPKSRVNLDDPRDFEKKIVR